MTERLDRARSLLRQAPSEVPLPDAQARVRAGVRAEVQRRWFEPTWAQVAPALGALAACWLYAVWPHPAPEAPRPPAAAGPVGAEFAATPKRPVSSPGPTPPVQGTSGPAKVTFAADALYRWPTDPLHPQGPQLSAGRVEVELATHERWPMETPQVALLGLGAHFWVEVGPEGTQVKVRTGTVEATPPGRAPEWVKAGSQRLFPRSGATSGPERRAVTASPPSAVPTPAPAPQPAIVDQEASTAPRSLPPAEQQRAIGAARAALAEDPPRAAELAEELLSTKPSQAIEVLALAVLADAERRRGALDRAETLYGQVARHPAGAALLEEALYRQALLAEARGAPRAALVALAEAEDKVATGPLWPERAALAARLHLQEGRALEAARVVEAVPLHDRPELLAQIRLEVALALGPASPERTRSLLSPLLWDDGVPATLAQRARGILGPEGGEPAGPR